METKKKSENLHDGHRARVRERFAKEGLEHFEGHQVLELLLFYAVKRTDTNELAHRMIDEFGSLSAVLEAPVEELAKFPYMTEPAVTLLRLMSELAAYYRSDKLKNICTLGNYNELFSYVRAMFMPIRQETVMLILMDAGSRILKTEKLFEGTVNMTQITARLIATHALRHGAVMAVLAHNHPDGNSLPSKEDIDTTLHLKRALEGIGINLTEHLVVGREDVTPIIQSSLMKELCTSLNVK